MLPGNNGLSSVFGEYRSDHFHAGIDFRAPEGRGMEVFALDSGYVERVEITVWNYGKALYFRTLDGKIAVYAHLDRYYPELDKYVRQVQAEIKSYTLKLRFEADEFPLARGQLIGYCGNTGTIIPHLHFELRAEDNSALNPLNHGFSMADNKPPIIKTLTIIPLNEDALINGGLEPVEFQAQLREGNFYTINDPVYFWGKVGFALCAEDYQDDQNPNGFGLYQYRLYLNDSLLFQTGYDQFQNSQGPLRNRVWNTDLERWMGKRYHQLFITAGATMPFWGKLEPGAGTLKASQLSQDTSLVRIVGEDHSGGKCELLFRLIRSVPGAISFYCEETEGGWWATLDLCDTTIYRNLQWRKNLGKGKWTSANPRREGKSEFFIALPDSASVKILEISSKSMDYPFPLYWCATPPEKYFESFPEPTIRWRLFQNLFIVEIEFSAFIQTNPFAWVRYLDPQNHILSEHSGIINAQSPTTYFTRIKPNPKASQISLSINWTNPSGISQQTESIKQYYLLKPGKGSKIQTACREVTLDVPPGAVFTETYITIEEGEMQIDLLPAMKYWRIEPEGFIFDQPVEIWLKIGKGITDRLRKGLVIAEYEDSSFDFIGNLIDTLRNEIGGRITTTSILCLISDTIRPEISPSVIEGAVYSKSPTVISARISDNLSGFSEQNLPEIYLDDTWVVGEYHPFEGKISYYPENHLPKGIHTVIFRAKDNAGNQAADTVNFILN
ncbi:M23 family metallopeptidase [bacterium]|nr:M23 family metallopeptidase [bacterium]